MLKKVLPMCLVLCMAFTLMIPGYAQSEEKISSDTIITEGNIYAVLAYLGIDSSNFEKSDNVNSGVVTVGELQKLIIEIKNAPKEPINTRSFAIDNTKNSISAITVNKTLMSEADYDQYSLMFSCTGTYQIGNPGWTSCSGGSVTADAYPPLDVKIKNYPSITTSLSSDKSKITLSYNLTVDVYAGIADIGGIYIHSVKHNGSCYFNASDFINT